VKNGRMVRMPILHLQGGKKGYVVPLANCCNNRIFFDMVRKKARIDSKIHEIRVAVFNLPRKLLEKRNGGKEK
jgi:hypothetical protein